MSIAVRMELIFRADRESFLEMAQRHFRELNPAFVPHEDWKQHYFNKIQSNPDWTLCWILQGEQRAGFILFGLEDHRFLPRKTGAIYEVFVLPGFRHKGIARECARQAICQLQAANPSKIQLEVVEGNIAAEQLWRSLGFRKVTARYVLTEEPK